MKDPASSQLGLHLEATDEEEVIRRISPTS